MIIKFVTFNLKNEKYHFKDYKKRLCIAGSRVMFPSRNQRILSLSIIIAMSHIWDKVLKNGPSKICGKKPLKILPGPILNTLSHMY